MIQFLPGDKGAKAEVEAAVERLRNARAKRAAHKESRMKRGRDLRKRPL